MEAVSYRDNPDLNLKVVVTKSGRSEYRTNCKAIRGELFIKNEECFEVNNSWYSIDSGKIVFNVQTKKWVLLNIKKDNIMKGIIDFKDSGTPVLGYFDYKPSQTVDVCNAYDGSKYACVSADIALKHCHEDKSSGVFYYNCNADNIRSFSKIKNSIDHKKKGYNIEDNPDEFSAKTMEFQNYPLRINKNVALFSKFLGDISFGVEAECIRGYMPDYLQHRYGVVICRDGSLHDPDGTQGPEYTTIPMTGAKGVQAIINIGKELTPRNVIDRHCAFHIHIGNLPTNRLFLVALYKLAYQIQDDVFKMFPYYKIDEKKYANKDKNYCKKLTRLSMFALKKYNKDSYDYYIQDNYIRIFSFLSNGVMPCKQYNRRLGIHPKANEKWNKVARYFWINFMNAIFSKRNTIEFRIHQGTTNPQKMITWLFMCNAIVKTAIARSADLLKGTKITLNDVFDYYANTFKTPSAKLLSDYLRSYYDERRKYFENDYKHEDYISERELTDDKNFFFDYPSISEMFK